MNAITIHVKSSFSIASVDKGTHARRTLRPAFRCVIVLDIRQYTCVLCLAKNAPERPAGLRVFPEHGRRLARQTRQMGCRPSTRITQPAVVQDRENHVCLCQLTLTLSVHMDSHKQSKVSATRVKRATNGIAVKLHRSFLQCFPKSPTSQQRSFYDMRSHVFRIAAISSRRPYTTGWWSR